MQKKSSESNDLNQSDINDTNNSQRHCLHSIRLWLNKFEKNKLEYYSVLYAIFGLSFLILSISILIIICTGYEHHRINLIDCSIINITHQHVKLCDSYRCRLLNYCIPYICTIIFVRYHYNNISYESKLFPSNIHSNTSCSYEPTSCLSSSRIQFEQVKFLEKFLSNISQTIPCCLHSLTQQPHICPDTLNSFQYPISIILIVLCSIIGLILIFIGILTQLHLNNYFRTTHKNEEDFLNTILNFHLSNGTIRSSIDKTTTTTPTPVNYDILTQTISYHNTPSITKMYRNDNLHFDIDEENQIFKDECLRSNYQQQIQNEIIRQYELNNEEIKIILKKIENDFKEKNPSIHLPKDSVEKIKYLLKTIDNLETDFPTISKQFSIDYISNTISFDQQSSAISVSPLSNIHFRSK